MTLSRPAPVAVPVSDLVRTARFYDAFLGPLGFHRLVRAGPYVGYSNGPITLWFVSQVGDGPTGGAPQDERDHLAFEVGSEEEVAAFAQALRAAGVSPARGPDEHRDLRPAAVSSVWLDPDGAVVEVYAARRRRVPMAAAARRRR